MRSRVFRDSFFSFALWCSYRNNKAYHIKQQNVFYCLSGYPNNKMYISCKFVVVHQRQLDFLKCPVLLFNTLPSHTIKTSLIATLKRLLAVKVQTIMNDKITAPKALKTNLIAYVFFVLSRIVYRVPHSCYRETSSGKGLFFHVTPHD